MPNTSNPRIFAVFAACVAALGGILFGYDTGLIADVQKAVSTTFSLSTWQWSLIVSTSVLAAFFGALLSGRAADYFGRRFMLIVIALGFVIGALVLTLAQGFYSLFIGRCILGLCIGVASYASPLFIAEVAPKAHRGALVLLNGIAITGGEALAFLSGYIILGHLANAWRWVFATATIPAAMLLLGMLFMPNSPRWLIEQGQIKKAKNVLEKIRNKADIDTELNDIIHAVKTHKAKIKPRFAQLFSKTLRPVILIGLILGIGQQFSGINTIMYYGPHIFLQAHFGSEHIAIFATFILGLFNLLGTIIAIVLVDIIGRRRLLIGGTLIAAFALIVVGTCFKHAQHNHILLYAMIIYMLAYAISIGSLFWLIISEIYPSHIRGFAMSFVSAIQWLANFIVALCFLPLLHAMGGAKVFWLFAFCTMALSVYSYFYVPETKGLSLEELG